jgi:hypothetical protein
LILKSKLGNSYPVADLSYLTGDVDGLDPVFAGRLAYVFKVESNKQGKVIKMTVTDGYRSLADQEKMYRDYKSGKLKATAAVPGTSWHGSRLAVDTSTQPIRRMTSADLKKYGLCKPILKEGWHIQPIETANMGVRANMSLAPEEVEDDEVEVQKLKVLMNGKETELDTILYKNENYMKIRDLANAQTDDKLTVDYDAVKKKVIISTK